MIFGSHTAPSRFVLRPQDLLIDPIKRTVDVFYCGSDVTGQGYIRSARYRFSGERISVVTAPLPTIHPMHPQSRPYVWEIQGIVPLNCKGRFTIHFGFAETNYSEHSCWHSMVFDEVSCRFSRKSLADPSVSSFKYWKDVLYPVHTANDGLYMAPAVIDPLTSDIRFATGLVFPVSFV